MALSDADGEDALRGHVRALQKEIGINEHFLQALFSEADDWSFVIKLNALIEAGGMKRTNVFAVFLILAAMFACGGPQSTGTPPTTQPTPTNSPCTFAISPSTANFATVGGSQVVNVTAAPSGCAPSAWSA